MRLLRAILMGWALLLGVSAHASFNLARQSIATQSSTYADSISYPASNATDGDNSTYSHTSYDAQAWIQLDLRQVSQVDSVVVVNRQGCCAGRLADFYVFVSDAPFTSTDLSTTQSQSGVSSYYFSGAPAAGAAVSFSIGRTGRYVRVQLSGTGYLHLGELQVLAPGGIDNGGFEAGAPGPNGYQYQPNDESPWSFSGSSGITTNGSVYTSYNGSNAPIPEGTVAAYLQGDAAVVSQNFTVYTTADYLLSFQTGNRYGYGGLQMISVRLDGIEVMRVTELNNPNWSRRALGLPHLAAGSHTLSFAGLNGTGDNTAFIDDVQFVKDASLVALYHFDEGGWNGTANELIDSSGNGHHGVAIGYWPPVASADNPPINANPGTCSYASTHGDYDYSEFRISGLPLSTASGDQTSVSFWMYWNGGDGPVVLSWVNYSLWLAWGQLGFVNLNGGQYRTYGTDRSGLANGWHHIAAVFTNGDDTKNKIWIDGVAKTLSDANGLGTNPAMGVGGDLIVAGFAGTSSNAFHSALDELKIYSGGVSESRVVADMSARHTCALSGTLGAFNAFESATPAGSLTGVLHTKVSAASFNADVVALNADMSAPLAFFSGDVKIELLDAHDNSGAFTGNCRASWTPLAGSTPATLTFTGNSSARQSIALVESNAWRDVRVRMTYPANGTPTSVACSTDDFAIRPLSLASVLATDATSATTGTGKKRILDNTAASGGAVHKAGQPFTIQAVAVNAISATTTGYDGTPAPSLTTCSGSACITPAGAVVLTSPAASGVINSAATYSDVGSFTLQLIDTTFAAVDAADGSSAAERTVASAAIDVGRFVPDHFDMTSLAAPTLRTFDSASCGTRSFTYIGQPFGFANVAQATVSAKNAAGVTTAGYAGSLWKLAASSLTQGYSPTPSSPSLDTAGVTGTAALTSNGNGTGLLVGAAGDKLRFTRPTAAPIARFNANIALTWSVTDASESGVAGNGSITTPSPLVYPSIAFDAGNDMRFGVLRLTPAYGSELIDLPVKIEAQFWDGQRMATNTADQCTVVPAATLTMGNYRRSLSACKTATSGPLTLAAGRAFAKLTKPGSGNSGSVDLSLQLGATASGQTCTAVNNAPAITSAANLPWLQGKWNGASAFDQNPATRASFGQYRSPMIYQREAF